ncbi:MAG TPA: RNA-binding protein [Dissulfurispiraceae bacterium]|nr:RNA-binding protein [Dissulfurispiraceae bacterium]
MGKKLYVGNISFKTTQDELKGLFEKAGEVESATIITDFHTGRSKGFGFVEMATEEDAKKAIESINGTVFMEKTLSVAEAKPQAPKGNKGGFGARRGGGGGGFGGGAGSRGPGRGRR